MAGGIGAVFPVATGSLFTVPVVPVFIAPVLVGDAGVKPELLFAELGFVNPEPELPVVPALTLPVFFGDAGVNPEFELEEVGLVKPPTELDPVVFVAGPLFAVDFVPLLAVAAPFVELFEAA